MHPGWCVLFSRPQFGFRTERGWELSSSQKRGKEVFSPDPPCPINAMRTQKPSG